MGYFESSRCKLYFEDSAERDPSALQKPVVLFINGWAISSRYWKPLVELLEPDFRCVVFDQGGTGKTVTAGYAPSFTIAGFSDEASGLVAHLGLDRSRQLHIVGHSMGGMVAAELCLRHADALVSATIIACGIFEENAFTSAGLFMLGGLIDVSLNLRFLFRIEPLRTMFIKRAAALEIPAEYQDVIIDDFTQSDREATIAVGKFSIDREVLRTYTRHVLAIAVPTLCCVGMADNTIPPEGTITLYNERSKVLPTVTRLARFEKLGHLPMLEDRARFAATLKEHFLTATQFCRNSSHES